MWYYIITEREITNKEGHHMTRTALVRGKDNNLHIKKDYGFHTSQNSFAVELRANGYKVLKIWNADMKDSEVDEWEYLNRK